MLTPERKEEIKANADEFWIKADNSRGPESHLSSEVFALCEGTNELLAALEEAERQLKQTAEDRDLWAADHAVEHKLRRESDSKLAEAQQTIARLTQFPRQPGARYGWTIEYDYLTKLEGIMAEHAMDYGSLEQTESVLLALEMVREGAKES